MHSSCLISTAAAAAIVALLSIAMVVPARAALSSNPHLVHWVSFDVPGSTYTQGGAVNDLGEIAGVYQDAQGNTHSFLRKVDGTIKTFDPPGAGTGANSNGIVSVPMGINNRGDIVGYYSDTATPYAGTHGFVRWADGSFTTIDDPSSSMSTSANAISDTGIIVGTYGDTTTFHGFIRDPNGSFVTIDAPGSDLTLCVDVNVEGEAACWSEFPSSSGFPPGRSVLRYASGHTVVYTAPGSPPSELGTSIGCLNFCGGYAGNPALNIEGDVTGYYADVNGFVHGYVRHANGSYVEFNAVNAADMNTVPSSINSLGTVVGGYSGPEPAFLEAFARFANGTLFLFQAPEPGEVGTEPFAINRCNEITGLWLDSNYVGHGFVAVVAP